MLSYLKGQNTIVVPYFDYGHWTLFILKGLKTYHFSAAMDVDNNMWVDDYITLLHVTWATTLEKNYSHVD